MKTLKLENLVTKDVVIEFEVKILPSAWYLKNPFKVNHSFYMYYITQPRNLI